MGKMNIVGKVIRDYLVLLFKNILNENQLDKNTSAQKDKIGRLQQSKNEVFVFWTKMTIKMKPQGPIFKKFEIWTKMAKVPKP
ncbi:hypothetical protein Hanom_Chr09g00835051 [Helianthus anomalus]